MRWELIDWVLGTDAPRKRWALAKDDGAKERRSPLGRFLRSAEAALTISSPVLELAHARQCAAQFLERGFVVIAGSADLRAGMTSFEICFLGEG